MNWMVVSILACITSACAPVLMVESVCAAHEDPDFASRRRRLWMATVIVIAGLLAWLYVDRVAVGGGERPLAVALGAAGAFTILFLAFAYPALRTVQAAGGAAPQKPTGSVSVFRVRTDVPVLLVFAAGLVGALLSPNEIGYRLKGAVMVGAALTFYFAGQPRALRTFLAFIGAAAITLFAQWDVPWQRTIGVASQVAVGVLGFVWCARLLTRPDRAA